MSALVQIVKALAASGATADMIVAAVEAHEAARSDALDQRRKADADRQARKRERERHVTSRDVTVTVSSRDARVVNTTSSSLRSEEGYDTTPQARERDLVAEMQEAAGPALDDTSPATHMPSEVRAWLDSGADFDLDVLPTIRARCSNRKPRSVRSWAYFTQAVTDARDRRLSGLPLPTLMIEGKPSVRPAYETTAQQFSRAFDNIGKRLAALDGD